MTFRARLLLASLPLALLPLVLFGLGARRDVSRRLETQYEERVAALADVVAEELAREAGSVSDRLARLAEGMAADGRLRAALLAPEEDSGAETRAYLLDYAPRAMPLAGLDVLMVLGPDGRVLTSGHFRNAYGSPAGVLAHALARAPERAVLADVATPSGSLRALTRAVPLEVGAESFAVVGGVAVDDAFVERLARGSGLEVTLAAGGRAPEGSPPDGSPPEGSPPDGTEAAGGASGLVREVSLPYVSAGGESVARFVVRASNAPLESLLRDLDRWLIGAAVLAALLALVLGAAAAAQLAGPVAELAHRANRLDLDRLDVSFASERLDEIGDLSRVLDRMTGRLRIGAARVRDAERRATTGDIARQVHHDVRNGLIPIRNVLSHLTQVAREAPAETADVLLERQGTLESSVAYLQSLATHYARLSPSVDRRECDVNGIVRDVAAAKGVAADLAPWLPPVLGDPVALRRVLENLVVNAVESLPHGVGAGNGSVRIATRLVRDSEPQHVRLIVSDRGKGMSEEERRHMFEDFYTTKAQGTGLGLSIVRRLVNDLGGRIEVASAPGEGTEVVVELPGAGGRREERST